MDSFYAGCGLGFSLHAVTNRVLGWPLASKPLLILPIMVGTGLIFSTMDLLRRKGLEKALNFEDEMDNRVDLRLSKRCKRTQTDQRSTGCESPDLIAPIATRMDMIQLMNKQEADHMETTHSVHHYIQDRLRHRQLTHRAVLACIGKCLNFSKQPTTLTKKEEECIAMQLQHFAGHLFSQQ